MKIYRLHKFAIADEHVKGFSEKLIKTAESNLSLHNDIDSNTFLVGKISSLFEAKKMCRDKFHRLPSVGHEIKIDEGYTKIKEKALGASGMTTEQQYKYKTYLQNNANQFRVWTWIDVSPSLSL